MNTINNPWFLSRKYMNEYTYVFTYTMNIYALYIINWRMGKKSEKEILRIVLVENILKT